MKPPNAVRTTLRRFFLDMDPVEINHGHCGLFAATTKALCPTLTVIRQGDHVYLTDGTLFYDAECPDGTSTLDGLPHYIRYPSDLLATPATTL